MKGCLLSAAAFSHMTLSQRLCALSSAQAAGGHQPAEGGHRATEEAAGQEEASEPRVSLAVSGLHL